MQVLSRGFLLYWHHDTAPTPWYKQSFGKLSSREIFLFFLFFLYFYVDRYQTDTTYDSPSKFSGMTSAASGSADEVETGYTFFPNDATPTGKQFNPSSVILKIPDLKK